MVVCEARRRIGDVTRGDKCFRNDALFEQSARPLAPLCEPLPPFASPGETRGLRRRVLRLALNFPPVTTHAQLPPQSHPNAEEHQCRDTKTEHDTVAALEETLRLCLARHTRVTNPKQSPRGEKKNDSVGHAPFGVGKLKCKAEIYGSYLFVSRSYSTTCQSSVSSH